MSLLDTRVPAVLLRTDRNPFHHGTLGAVRSLGRAEVEVHVVADSAGSPVRRSRYVHRMHSPPPPGASAEQILAVLRKRKADLTRVDTEVMRDAIDRIQDLVDARPPDGPADDGWRHALLDLGHDPLNES